jgi:2-C-methyl-D-erythritol 4-phosphate cytidylyltransferase
MTASPQFAGQDPPKTYAIIVAGGSGTRMGTVIPKQFLLIHGKPVLMHTIEAFHRSASNPHIIVVLPPNFHSYWDELCIKHHFKIDHDLVSGGETRFHSVKNGLDIVPGNPLALVAIHDAVRPLAGAGLIDAAYSQSAQLGNAIAAVKSRDSIRLQKADTTVSLLRNDVYLIQTPQTFRLDQLKAAYLQPYDQKFTDDASVVEQAGFAIHLVEGEYNNIKITFLADLAVAELFLGQ